MPVDGAAEIYCDNKSVVKNPSIPTSVWEKSNENICHHMVIGGHAAGGLCVLLIPSYFNLEYLIRGGGGGVTGNTRKILVEVIFSNSAYLIDGI